MSVLKGNFKKMFQNSIETGFEEQTLNELDGSEKWCTREWDNLLHLASRCLVKEKVIKNPLRCIRSWSASTSALQFLLRSFSFPVFHDSKRHINNCASYLKTLNLSLLVYFPVSFHSRHFLTLNFIPQSHHMHFLMLHYYVTIFSSLLFLPASNKIYIVQRFITFCRSFINDTSPWCVYSSCSLGT